MLARLRRAGVTSIASIRGRATGVGSELALVSDMRLASREKAILSQWEVSAGLVPGGGPISPAKAATIGICSSVVKGARAPPPMDVRFRTTRWFTRRGGMWRQLHHHGSKSLDCQKTILGAALGEAA